MRIIKPIAIGLGFTMLIFAGILLAAGPGPTPEEIRVINENATLNTVISSANEANEITEASLAAHDIFIENPETEWDAYFNIIFDWSGRLSDLRSSLNGLDYTGMEEINRTSRAYISSCQAVNSNLITMDGCTAGGQIEEAEEARGELNEALRQCVESHKELKKAVNDFQEARKL